MYVVPSKAVFLQLMVILSMPMGFKWCSTLHYYYYIRSSQEAGIKRTSFLNNFLRRILTKGLQRGIPGDGLKSEDGGHNGAIKTPAFLCVLHLLSHCYGCFLIIHRAYPACK